MTDPTLDPTRLEAAYKAFDEEPRTAYDGYQAALKGGLSAAITAYNALPAGDDAELVERLRAVASDLGPLPVATRSVNEAATAIERLMRERDQARTEVDTVRRVTIHQCAAIAFQYDPEANMHTNHAVAANAANNIGGTIRALGNDDAGASASDNAIGDEDA